MGTLPLQEAFAEGYSLLTASRRARVDALVTAQSKLNSMAAGLLLRKFLQITDDAQLNYSENGKPFLPGGQYFSISHSGNWCALAVSDIPVGADIEVPRGVSSALIRRCLTHEEQVWCADSTERFLQLWTRKESVMKACGKGLTMGLRSISVLPDEDVTADGRLWTLKTFQAGECICSVACESKFDLILKQLTVEDLLPNNETEDSI